MSDNDKNKDLLNEFLIDEDSDAVEKELQKIQYKYSFNNPWEESSENSETKKESFDNSNEDQNKNNNEKDEIKSAVPKSNSSQNKDRKKLVIQNPNSNFFLSYYFYRYIILSLLYLNPVSNNSDIKQNTPPKLVTLSYRNNQETYNSILDNNDWSGDDYVFILKIILILQLNKLRLKLSKNHVILLMILKVKKVW